MSNEDEIKKRQEQQRIIEELNRRQREEELRRIEEQQRRDRELWNKKEGKPKDQGPDEDD